MSDKEKWLQEQRNYFQQLINVNDCSICTYNQSDTCNNCRQKDCWKQGITNEGYEAFISQHWEYNYVSKKCDNCGHTGLDMHRIHGMDGLLYCEKCQDKNGVV